MHVALYFKGMSNSKDFHKGIFLHVIPVHIIIPWSHIFQKYAQHMIGEVSLEM